MSQVGIKPGTSLKLLKHRTTCELLDVECVESWGECFRPKLLMLLHPIRSWLPWLSLTSMVSTIVPPEVWFSSDLILSEWTCTVALHRNAHWKTFWQLNLSECDLKVQRKCCKRGLPFLHPLNCLSMVASNSEMTSSYLDLLLRLTPKKQLGIVWEAVQHYFDYQDLPSTSKY